MKILVVGGTGTVGSHVVRELLARGAQVRALVRSKEAAKKLPEAVEPATGELLDPESVRKAMAGVDKLYLLNAVVPDELTQGRIAYDLAKRLGLKQVVYHSVFRAGAVPGRAPLRAPRSPSRPRQGGRCPVHDHPPELLLPERRAAQGRPHQGRDVPDAARHAGHLGGGRTPGHVAAAAAIALTTDGQRWQDLQPERARCAERPECRLDLERPPGETGHLHG